MQGKINDLLENTYSQNKTHSSLTQFMPVITTQHQLFSKYSSSQHYFYSNKINQIIKQKCVHNNIIFQDIECLLDQEQYLKRHYYEDQYPRKLSTFKQYYFYHEDCPRVFGDIGVAEAYEKWQQRKRDYMYKKLKFMYNQTYTSMNSSQNTGDQHDNNLVHVTHFLLDISDYNPYSKKYYLRVQARQQKQREQKQRKAKQQQKLRRVQRQSNQSAILYNKMTKQLNKMLGNIENQLSILTVMNEQQNNNNTLSPNSRRRTIKISQINNKKTVKANFLKKKQLIFASPIKYTNQQKQKQLNKQIQNQQKNHNYILIETESPIQKKSSHKRQISDYQLRNNINNPINVSKNIQKVDSKMRSIMMMSSFGTNNNNQFVGSSKSKLIKFGDQHYKHRLEKVQEKKGNNLQPYAIIPNNNLIKSYKSLQKIDRFNPNGLVQQQISGSKRSYSLLKIQTPIIQKNNLETLTKIINKKLSQKSVKKPAWQIQRPKIQQFNDRKIFSKGLISYKSEKFQSSTSASINYRNNSIKGPLGLKFKEEKIQNAQLKIDGNNLKILDVDKSQKKSNIRISVKNTKSTGKIFPTKINK